MNAGLDLVSILEPLDAAQGRGLSRALGRFDRAMGRG